MACCKAINALLGSMSLKEKIQVVLNQQGQFKCPNGAGSRKTEAKGSAHTDSARLKQVLANLKQRGNSRPRMLKTLTSTVASLFPKGLPEAELSELIQQSKGRFVPIYMVIYS